MEAEASQCTCLIQYKGTLQWHSCTGGDMRGSWLAEFELQCFNWVSSMTQVNSVFSRHSFTLEAAWMSSPSQIRHGYPKIFNTGTHLQERGLFHFLISDKYVGKCWILNIICLLCCRPCINPTHCVLFRKRIGREKKYSEQQMVGDVITVWAVITLI